jgi:polar amino acid transport system substrate-binding protein
MVLTEAPQISDPRVADLVQAGKIRVALYLPMYTQDSSTGELRGGADGGAVIEIARALGARIGIEVYLIGYPTPPVALDGLKAGECDMILMGIDPIRASEVDFSPPVVQFDYTCLVPAASSIHSFADVDRRDIRIAVVRNHASTLALSRILKHAELVYAETPDSTFEVVRTGRADVFASTRFALLNYSTKQPGFRVLEDRYGANLLALAIPKGRAQRLAYVSEFIEQAKASGLVQKAIDRAGPHGVTVAATGDVH